MTTAALNVPIRKARKEVHNVEQKIEQHADVITAPGEALELDPDIIVIDEKQLKKEQADQLKFNRMPLTITIGLSTEKNHPQVTDYVACQGETPKMLVNGQWIPSFGYLPRGEVITIERRFVEILLRAKLMSIEHDVTEDKKNRFNRTITPSLPVSLIGGTSQDQDWFQRLSRGR